MEPLKIRKRVLKHCTLDTQKQDFILPILTIIRPNTTNSFNMQKEDACGLYTGHCFEVQLSAGPCSTSPIAAALYLAHVPLTGARLLSLSTLCFACPAEPSPYRTHSGQKTPWDAAGSRGRVKSLWELVSDWCIPFPVGSCRGRSGVVVGRHDGGLTSWRSRDVEEINYG